MKTRKSIPISKAATVDVRQVNVAIEGIDCSQIKGSFRVHLLRDGQRIASRFLLRPAQAEEQVEGAEAEAKAHFDFLLPIDVVADGKLSVEVESVESVEANENGKCVPAERLGNPMMSVYCMLAPE